MLRNILITICLLLFVALAAAGGAETPKIMGVDPALIDQAFQAQGLILMRKYDEAKEVFEAIEHDYPDSPTGIAGQMAIWQVKMFEHDDFRFAKEFTAAEERYRKFQTKQIRGGDVTAWDLFVYGAADGMRGFFHTREEKWLKALSHSLHAVKMLSQLKWQEPTFIDADLGLGAYKYWRSAMTQELKFLPFFSDQREAGIQLVESVVRNGRYAKELALANLVFIYANENQHDKAVKAADDLLARYPENIIMRYQKGRIKLWAKKYDESLKLFQEVYKMDPSIYKALLYEGEVYVRKGEREQAKSALKKYLDLDHENYGRARALMFLGQMAEAEGDKKQAVDFYKESLKLYKSKWIENRLKGL